MAKMKSKLPDRRKAAQAIEDMAADLQARGLALWSVRAPGKSGEWNLRVVLPDGSFLGFVEPTLDECYLAAMHYPDTPPPF